MSKMGTLKAQATKGKIYKLEIINIKNFCASKGTIKKLKTDQSIETMTLTITLTSSVPYTTHSIEAIRESGL